MRLAYLTLALCLAALASACGDKDHEDSGEGHAHHDDGHGHGHGEGADVDGDAAAGAAIFATSCAGCHGVDGSGDHAPAMSEVVPGHTAADIVDVVLNGSGEMGPVLSDSQDAADVAIYCKETWSE